MTHTNTLCILASDLLDPNEYQALQDLLQIQPLDFDQLVEFDLVLGGPNMSKLTVNNEGQYNIADRDVFRPLQYCFMHFRDGCKSDNLEWKTRHIVHISSLHIESIIKRIGRVWRFPLGKALRESIVKRKLDPKTWQQIDTFTQIYNDSKHNVSHPKDTHLFSVQDAILAYVISRKLGTELYHLVQLKTDLETFQ